MALRALAVVMAAVLGTDRASDTGDGDFTAQNQQKIGDARTALSEFEQTQKTAVATIQNEWQEAFSAAVSSIKERLQTIATSMTQGQQTFKSSLNTNEPLKGVGKSIINAGLAAQKHSQKSTKEFAKIESSFEKTATTNLNAYLKKAVTQTQNMNKEVEKRQKEILKLTQGNNAEIASEARRIGDDLSKYEKKSSEVRDKYEGKFDSTRNKLEEILEHGDDNFVRMQDYVEDLQADVTNVVESEDPEAPGLEMKLGEAERKVTEAMESSQEELQGMSKMFGEDMQYAAEDIQTGFADTGHELADKGRIYAEHITQSGNKVRQALDSAKVANKGAQSQLAQNVESEFKRAEGLSTQLEDIANHVEHVKDVMHGQLEKMVETAVTQLETVFDEQHNAFESKRGAVFTYIDSGKEMEMTKVESHIEKVKGAFLAEVQQAASQSVSYTNQAQASLYQAVTSLANAMDKMGKVSDELAQQAITKDVIPRHINTIEVAKSSLKSTVSQTITAVKALKKEEEAAAEEAGYGARKTMGTAYEAMIKSINDKAELESSAIGSTAGLASERLNNMVEDNLHHFQHLKADVDVADQALASTEEMLRKAYEFLQAVPDTFTNLGARTTEAIRDVVYESEKWVKDEEEPIANGIKFSKTKAARRFDAMSDEVEASEQQSTKRISIQADEMTKMLERETADQATKRQAVLAERNAIEQDVNAKHEDIAAWSRRWGTALKSDTEEHEENSAKFKGALAAEQQQWADLSADTKTTGAAVIQQFQQHVGEALGSFSNAILLTSKNAEVAVLDAKKAIREATQKDTLNFQRAAMKLQTKLKDTMAEQARLKKASLNQQGGDEQAVADESLATVEAAERAVQALLDKMKTGIERIASKAQDKMMAAVTAHDAERTNIKLMMSQQLSALQAEQRKSHRLFKERVDATHANFEVSAKQMSESMLEMERKIAEEERNANERAAEASQGVDAAEHQFSNQMRNDMVQTSAWEQAHGSEADAEAMLTNQVEAMAERTSASVDREVGRAEQAAHDHIEALKPTSKEAKLQAEVEALAKLFDGELHKTQSLQEAAEAAAARLSEGSESGVTAAQIKLAALDHNIDKAFKESDDTFQQVSEHQNASHVDIKSVLSQLVDLGIDMKVAMHQKGLDLQKNIKDAEDQVKNMSDMGKYASGSELQRIEDALEVGTKQTQDIWTMITDEVDPATREQRKRLGQVFEDSGASLDLDRIQSMMNDTVGEELSARTRLTKAREYIEGELNDQAKKTSVALNGVFEKTKHLIDQVQKMDHLSALEKKNKVQAIKAAAARQTAKIMASARAEVQSQMKAGRDMDAKQQEVGVLLARAKTLSEGGFQTTNKAFIKKELDKAKGGIEAVRDKWVNPFSESLLQETEEAQRSSIAASLLQESRAWTPAMELSTDLREAESLAKRRDDEDAGLEQTLRNLRAVGS